MSKIQYHPNFDKYVEMIVAHPNYKGLFYERKKDGHVNWVVTGKSKKGKIRQAWWNNTCVNLGIKIQKGRYAKAARIIHPTGKHVCQCCGKERSIFYEYPTLITLKRINALFNIKLHQTDYTIKEIILTYCKTSNHIKSLAEMFKLPLPEDINELIHNIYTQLVQTESSFFSPGVMCNPPDRFNGFHSYALCCRKEKDTGRHDDNMKTYTQDRRAYEEWSDGNYNLANRLMGEFRKLTPMKCPVCDKVDDMTADHIGPISLGFCHSKHFTPMCRSCNSAKNNRFTKSDVEKLINLENKGFKIISWHSKFIWDLVKNQIKNDDDAKKASSIMSKCHQNVLNILSLIYKHSGQIFLIRYLHPEYSMIDYQFENFNPHDLQSINIITNPLDSKNKRKNQERYIRIAFESLEEFGAKTNRKNYFLVDNTTLELQNIILAIHKQSYELADKKLKELIENISKKIYEEETGRKLYMLSPENIIFKAAESGSEC